MSESIFFFDGISLSTASPDRRRRKNISGGGGFIRGHHLCLVVCGPYLELCDGQWYISNNESYGKVANK